LRLGGPSHHSITEFRNLRQIEREADSFAASLLLPTKFVRPQINKAQLTMPRIMELAKDYNVSLVGTAFRAVRLSHFPCALAGIRQGSVAWMFVSDAMFQNGLYPKRGHLPLTAIDAYSQFQTGILDRKDGEAQAREWFTIYDDDRLGDLYVSEEYVPARYMDTLIVLLSMDEQDFEQDEEADEDDE
jgi:hypothetical protein